MNIKILTFKRKRGTFWFNIVNFKTKEAYSLYFQFSLEKPWLIPHYEENYSNLNIPLYGWLFFYFGRESIGFIYETENKDAKISHKNKRYYLYTISQELRKDFRKKNKKGYIPTLKETK